MRIHELIGFAGWRKHSLRAAPRRLSVVHEVQQQRVCDSLLDSSGPFLRKRFVANKKSDSENETRKASRKHERIDGGAKNSYARRGVRERYDDNDEGRPSSRPFLENRARQNSKRRPRQNARQRRIRPNDDLEDDLDENYPR